MTCLKATQLVMTELGFPPGSVHEKSRSRCTKRALGWLENRPHRRNVTLEPDWALQAPGRDPQQRHPQRRLLSHHLHK